MGKHWSEVLNSSDCSIRPLFHRPTLLISIHLSLFLSTPLLPTPSMEWNEHSGPRANRSERLIAWHARRIKKRWRARCSPLTLPISSNPPPLSLSLIVLASLLLRLLCEVLFFKSPACTAVRPTPRLDILLGETFKRGFTVKWEKNGRWKNRRVWNDTLRGFFSFLLFFFWRGRMRRFF